MQPRPYATSVGGRLSALLFYLKRGTMKRIASLLVAMVIFLSACASLASSTSAPVEQADATSTSQPTTFPATNVATSTFTPEPTLTPTPVPPSLRWYWSVDDSDTIKVIAVNQFGERREIGTLDQADDLHTAVTSLDHERAILFLDNSDTLRVYLLTPDGMQKIKLPYEPFYFNTEFAQTNRAIIAVYEDHVLFSYVTKSASNIMPDTGPIFLMDLTTLTTKMIDETVSRDPYSNNRYWFHASPDGRYLRYMSGDQKKIGVRELDMVTGEARTLFMTSGSSYNIRTSPQGDIWYLRADKKILDINGNKTDLTDESQTVRPMQDGNIAIYPRECVDDCEIKVITPFGNAAKLTYNFPWVIESASIYNNLNQVLPDQSLLVAGRPSAFLSKTPAAVADYPNLLEEDSPLFRLTPDGQARLVGIYIGNTSEDGRYILLRSSDQSSFFVYDAVADRPLFDIPIDNALEDYFVMSVQFFDTGILINLIPSVPGGQNEYRYFYHAYIHKTSTPIAWEDVNAEINSCPDLLDDGTLICWFYRTDSTNFDIVRYYPASGTKTVLLENVWLVEFAQ